MLESKLRKIILFYTLIARVVLIYAVDYGSDTAVSIQNPQNITGQGNIIKTFAFCKNGFTYTDASATCSWQSIFPITGDINLAGGSLYLLNDLTLNNVAAFKDIGTIYGRSHRVNLSENFKTFGTESAAETARVLSLITRVTETREMYSVDWSYDGNYVAVSTASGPGNDFNIYAFNGSTLTLVAGFNYGGSGYDVKWNPNSYFIAATSSSTSYKINLFQFTPPNTLTLRNAQNPTGTFYAIAWTGDGTRIAAGGTTLTSYRFNTATNVYDTQITPTNTAALNGNITANSIRWAPRGSKQDLIAVTNNGGTTGSMHLYNFTGAALNLLKSYDLGIASNCLDWAATSTYLAVGFANSTIKTYEHTAATNIISYKKNYTAPSAVNSLSFTGNGKYLAAGYAIAAAGNEFELLYLNPTTYALAIQFSLDLTGAVNTVRFTPGASTYMLRADATTRYLSVYRSANSPFKLIDTKLFLNSDLDLYAPLTFTGNSLIFGGGHRINFYDAGALNLDQNSSLSLQQVKLTFNNSSSFALQGSRSEITFKDSIIELNHDITWGDGKFDVIGDLTITGAYTFNYDTAQTSTIQEHSTLNIQNSCEFKLGRNSINQIRDPLEFENASSELILQDSKLHITDWGLKIKKGTLVATGDSTFDIDYSDTSLSSTTQALVFGDGINAYNDAVIKLRGSSTRLTLSSGSIVLDNVTTKSTIQILGQPVIDIQTPNLLYFKKPVELTNGTLKVSPNALFYIDPTSYLTYNNVEIQDSNKSYDFYATGTNGYLGDIILDENGEIFLASGTLASAFTIIRGSNIIHGTGAFTGLLNFTDANSTLSWDISTRLNPMTDVDLKGGRIIFTTDVGFTDNHVFTNTGTVDLTEYTFELGPEYSEWLGNIYWIGNGATLRLNNDVYLSGIWTFSGDVIIDGNSFVLDLDQSGTIILERGAHVTFKNISLYNLTRQNRIICNDNNSQIKLNFTDLMLSGDYLFETGGIYVYYDSTIGIIDGLDGVFTFTYASTQTSTIDSQCVFEIEKGVRFSIGRQDSTITDMNQQPLIFTDAASSKLALNGGTLHITSSGMFLGAGALQINNASYLEIENRAYPYGLVLGNGEEVYDFKLDINAGTQLTLKSGKLFYNNYFDNRIVFGGQESTIAIETEKGLHPKRDLTLELGAITTPLPTDTILGRDENIYVIYKNFHRYDYGHIQDFYLTGTAVSEPTPISILDSNDSLLLNPGTYNRNILVNQSGNRIAGVGNISGNINFTDWNSTLTWDLNQSYNSGNIDLKGGRIIYTQDSGIGPQYSFIGSGTIDLTTKKLELGTVATTWTGNFYWIGDGGIIRMNNDIILDGTWTISGNVTIEGNGYSMDLGTTGTIILERGAQLTFNNFALYNMTRQNGIFCSDNNCLITLNYTDLVLADNFLFDKGGIYVYYDSIIMPISPDLDRMFTFSYFSTVPFEIDSDSSIDIWSGIRFSTGRQDSTITDPDQQPIIFYDPGTARFILNGGTLHITSSGMILTKGTIDVASSSNLEIETPKFEYGLVLGDGTPSNDFLLNIDAGIQLTLKSGKIFYNNHANNRIVLNSPASVIAVESYKGLTAKNDLILSLGAFASPNPNDIIFGWDPGIYVTANNIHRYDYGHINDYYITGTLTPPTLVLDSNDQILTNPGTFNRNIDIKQYGNKVTGIGNISGQLNFTDWRSSLTWDINQSYNAGNINLNGGRIIYTQDSGLGDGYSFVGTGTIDLTNQTLEIGHLDTTWVGNLYWVGDGGTIILNNNVTIDGTWTLSGNITIIGNNYLIDLAPTGSIILERGAQVTFKDFSVYNMSRQNPITCMDNDCQITLNVADLVLADDYLFDTGSIFVYYNSSIGLIDGLDGLCTFTYASTQSSTIDSFAYLKIRPGARFSIGRQDGTISNSEQQPLLFVDPLTSQLILDGGTLHITSSGMIMTGGKIMVSNSSNIEVENTTYPYGLVLGDGTPNNDFELKLLAGFNLKLKSGRIFYNNHANDRIVFDSPESNLSVEINNGLFAKRDLTITQGTISTPQISNVPVGRTSDINIVYQNTHRYDYSHILDFFITGTPRVIPTPATVLDSNDRLLINPGDFDRPIVIKQYGNYLSGVGSVSGQIEFTDYRSSLTWDMNVKYSGGDIDLKGGRIIYTQDSGIGPQYSFKGSGTIDLTTKTLELGTAATTWTGNFYWVGDGGIIRMNNDITLDGTWTISGNVTIEGNGYSMDLGTTGTIILERGAQLTFNNFALYNMTRQNGIFCSDNNCLITLNFVDFVLADDFLFDKGGIYVYYDSIFMPISPDLDRMFTFSYSSTIPFEIDSDSSIDIWSGIRFSTGRQDSTITDPDQQPIIFYDPETARFILNGGTLHITSSGMILTKGTIDVASSSNLEIETPKFEYGLVLGDGTPSNDFLLNIDAGIQLTLKSGQIFYNNYSATDRIAFESPESTLRILPSNGLTAKRNLTVSNGTLWASGSSAVANDSGVAVIQQNMIHKHDIPYSVHRVTIHGSSPYYLLENGDSFLPLEGSSNKTIVCNSGSSYFGGTGGFLGSIILNNRATTLQITLETPLFNNITLNGGTISSMLNTEFTADKTFTGSGNVQLYGTKIIFGSSADTNMTNTIYWQGITKGGIELNANKTSLSGTWTIGGNIVLNGKGNILDLTNHGQLTIRPNSTLSLENIALKGLGTNFGAINFMDDTATLRLCNTYIELDSNMSTTIGGMIVNGPTVFGLKKYDWTLDQNASMTIDGVTLWQDALGETSYGKIKFGSGDINKYLSLVSSGTIKTATNLDSLQADPIYLQQQITNNSNAINYQAEHFISLNNAKFYTINGISGATTIDGHGKASGAINLSGSTLTINKDLNLGQQTTINSSGNLDLLSNAIIMDGDLTIPENSFIKITSSGIIDGQSHNFTLAPGAKLVVDNNVTLTLRNMNWLSPASSPQIEMRAATSALTLENIALSFDRDFSFTQGTLFVQSDVFFTGTNKFSYASTSTAHIASHSTLYIDANTTFSYSPRPTGRHALSERNLIKLTDRTSSIFFDECTIQAPDSGWQLTKGTLFFNNRVKVYGQTKQAESFEFGNGTSAGDIEIQLLSGANIENHGYIYLNTTNQ